MGICVPGTYLVITSEVEVAVDNLTCWLCELYLEYDSHICSLIYVGYVYILVWLMPATSYVAHICAYITHI